MSRASVVVCLIALAACARKQDEKPAPGPAVAAPDAAGSGSVAEREPLPAVMPPLTDAEFEAMMQKAIAMFRAMGAVADRSGDDCGKLADGLDGVMTTYSDFIVRAGRYRTVPDIDKRADAWMKEHQTEVMEPMMKVATIGQHCTDDPKFLATMKKLGELGN